MPMAKDYFYQATLMRTNHVPDMTSETFLILKTVRLIIPILQQRNLRLRETNEQCDQRRGQ
jgi:hypothetical protein